MSDRPSEHELNTLADSLEPQQPWDALRYALDRYETKIILACSFGAEDVALIDMMHRIRPQAPLFYLDTAFLFPETYDVRDRIVATYGLTPNQVLRVTSRLSPEQQAAEFGEALWRTDPDRCCQLRKVEPLARILRGYAAWITGIRRDQAPSRAHTRMIEWDEKFQLVKFNPLARWTADEVWTYIRLHDVPYNELHDRHYPSIGCTHCTAPVQPGEDPRSGRWKHTGKTECGLHTKT